MLVTFKTDAYSNIMMFGSDAIPLIKIMGHSGTIPGSIPAEAVPAALARLLAAIEAEKAKGTVPDKGEAELSVSVVSRALPLIELFTAAARDQCYVMWQ